MISGSFCKICNEWAKRFDLFFWKTKCLFKVQLKETKNVFALRKFPLDRGGTLQDQEVQEKVASPY